MLSSKSGDPTLDLRLPVLSGEEFRRIQRQYLRWAEIPVVVITATPERAAQLGAIAVLSKPLDWAAFLATVQGQCPITPPAEE